MKAWGRVSGDIAVEEIVYGVWPVSMRWLPTKRWTSEYVQIVVFAEHNRRG